ncbi:MAG: dTDP-4-dehydrorhamnose 3,5-epimerase [Saprospiraceae bacterium]|jgi:dTDP-4-dehydrorhamnose 3,5-epimerase|nr:dTDP-4-dehydrorhamnose 3,5-epimerase [Saprospiraceae bacterium]
MLFEKTRINGIIIIRPKVFQDERGYFVETFNQEKCPDDLKNINFVQDNESCSNYGVIRGLHFQEGTYAQAKLVRVIKGRVLDVVLDLRIDSETYGQTFSIELSGENKTQMFIPRGFAHGYSVLQDDSIFAYKCDNYYRKETEKGINPMDSSLQIDWRIPTEHHIISEKDRAWPVLIK